MEDDNNAPVRPNENGSGSQDSFITDDNSKDGAGPSAAGPTDGDDNLSPISDSELEDDATNDTTDARPVTPTPSAEPVSLSNDDAESVKNDNEGGVAEQKPSDTEEISEDVEMKDVDEKTSDGASATAPTPSEEERAEAEDVDRENNNSPAAATESPQQTPVAEEPVESMDVDETDKAKVQSDTDPATATPAGEKAPVDEASQLDPENESTNVSSSDNQTATEEGHFQCVTGTESANVSTSGNQPDTDMLNDAMATDTQAGEEENAEQNVQEIEIGVFRDVTVTTDLILTRQVYDKILEDTHKNIILESAWKTPELPLPASRSPLQENEIREMDDDERLSADMSSKPCLRCLEEKPATHKMIRNLELDYFCSLQCTADFKAASSLSDVLTITEKRKAILRYPLTDPRDCAVCEKKDVRAKFKFNDGDEVKFLCDDECLEKYTGHDWDKYVVSLGWFVAEANPSGETTTDQCCKCREEEKPCTLRLRQAGLVENIYLLCSDACRDSVLSDLSPSDLPKKPEFVLHLDDVEETILDMDLALPRSASDSERLKAAQEETLLRKCHQCAATIEEAGLSNVHWQFMDFCCGDCLFEYKKKTLVPADAEEQLCKCATCKEVMAVDDKVGRFMILHGADSKAFCNESCLVRYKDTHRVCWSCLKSVAKEEAPPPATEAQSDWDAMMGTEKNAETARFCSDSCEKRFDRTIARIKLATGTDTAVLCHVCNHEKQIAVTCQVNNKVISLCSQACLYAFKFANNVAPQSCRTCNRFFEQSPQRQFTIYSFSGDTSEAYSFCTRSCRDLYVAREARDHAMACSWCGITKRECDLLRLRSFGDTYKPALVCSVECERLLRFVVDQRTDRLKDTWSCTFCQKTADFDVQRRLILLPAVIGDSSSWRSFCSSKCARSSVGDDLLDQNKFEECLRRLTKDALTNLVENLLKPKPTLSVRDGASLRDLNNSPDGFDDNSSHYVDDYAHSTRTSMSPPPVRRGRGRPKGMQVQIRTEPALVPQRLPPPRPAPEIRTQVITVAPPPTVVRNCATMCRPVMESRGTMARPKKVSVECQTESQLERRYLIPVPVPIYVPTPLPMYSLPVPTPVPIPIPIPVPIFIPTTRNSAEGIMNEIKKIQDKMPTDPYEAELLLMAEMVADDAKKTEVSDSDSEDDRPLKALVGNGGLQHQHQHHMVPEYHHLGSHSVAAHATVGGGSTALEGEDMLMMALKMAYDEPAVDLEASMTANTISQAHETHHQYDHHNMMGMQQQQQHLTQDAYNMAMGHQQGQQGHSLLLLESSHHLQQQEVVSQPVARGRKRASTRGGARGGVQAQPSPVIQPPPNKRRTQQPTSTTYSQEQHQRDMERAESNMCLKYTFGVNAWKQWVTNERANSTRRKPLKTDLLSLTTEELNYSLSLFVKEVRKPNGTEYAPDTIYYLVLGIQQYLYENGRIDNIFTDVYFESFTNCLDEVARKFSVLYNDSQYIVTRVEEEHLWECKQLGAHSPHVLLSTLMFFNTKHFNLTTVEEHMQLSFSHIMKHWKRGGGPANKSTGLRNVLLRFYPPQAALDANSRKKKVYEQQENEENPLRCPVKLYEFYLSKCPESVKTRNDVFYLLPERSCVPDSPVWYSTQALGKPALMKMLHRVKMVKEINIALLTS